MSYDIYLNSPPCDKCGRTDCYDDALPDPTYNLTPIFDLALTGEPLPNQGASEFEVVVLGIGTDRPRGLRLLSGKRAGDTIDLLARAEEALCDPARDVEFKALEPENGWGTLDDARKVIACLLRAAREAPEMIWEIR